VHNDRHSVFISYSHRDQAWLERVSVHLRPLVREHRLVVWDDTRIAPGTKWKAEIESAIAVARVAVLLVSADYLASDFVASSEIPALLAAAEDEGATILSLILSPSRFAHTVLSRYQAVNAPSRPLLGMSAAEQEETLVRLTEAIERALAAIPAPVAESGLGSALSPAFVQRLRISEWLPRLGCAAALAVDEEEFIRKWLEERLANPVGGSNGPGVRDHFVALGEPDDVARRVEVLSDDALNYCSPDRWRLSSLYLSIRKVSETFRRLERNGSAPATLSVDGPAGRMQAIHEHLLRNNRLIFLPEGLLLGAAMPAVEDDVFYFAGTFRFQVDSGEISKVPGASELIGRGERKTLYSVVSAVFHSPDPFIYPMLQFAGQLGQFPVTMNLSRKYIEFSSSTATTLAGALAGAPTRLCGIASLRRVGTVVELHPFECGESHVEETSIEG